MLDLIHPRAVNGREMHERTRVPRQPNPHQLAMKDADIVANQMDRGDGLKEKSHRPKHENHKQVWKACPKLREVVLRTEQRWMNSQLRNEKCLTFAIILRERHFISGKGRACRLSSQTMGKCALK